MHAVEFHQTKNGLPSLCALSIKLSAAVLTYSSTVSMRFFVSVRFAPPAGRHHWQCLLVEPL